MSTAASEASLSAVVDECADGEKTGGLDTSWSVIARDRDWVFRGCPPAGLPHRAAEWPAGQTARLRGIWITEPADADLFWEKSTTGWLLVAVCCERKVLLAGGW
jgi:hypothetical protein